MRVQTPKTAAGPGRFGRFGVRHPRVMHAVTAVGLAWGTVYLGWRVTSTYDGANPVLGTSDKGTATLIELMSIVTLPAGRAFRTGASGCRAESPPR